MENKELEKLTSHELIRKRDQAWEMVSLAAVDKDWEDAARWRAVAYGCTQELLSRQ